MWYIMIWQLYYYAESEDENKYYATMSNFMYMMQNLERVLSRPTANNLAGKY